MGIETEPFVLGRQLQFARCQVRRMLIKVWGSSACKPCNHVQSCCQPPVASLHEHCVMLLSLLFLERTALEQCGVLGLALFPAACIAYLPPPPQPSQTPPSSDSIHPWQIAFEHQKPSYSHRQWNLLCRSSCVYPQLKSMTSIF